MSISEQVGFLDDAIKGHVKVQLMEQDKVVQEVEADNFIGSSVYNWLLALLGSSFADFIASSQTAVFQKGYPLVRFKLTTNTSTIPASSSSIPGNEIGYVLRQPYAGSDPLRGAINQAESSFSRNKVKIVMDFTTNAGNGTFQTLGFTNPSRVNVDPVVVTTSSPVNSFKAATQDLSNTIYLGISTNIIGVYNVSTGDYYEKTFSPSRNYHTLAFHDGKLYLYYGPSSGDRPLYSIDVTESTWTSAQVGVLTGSASLGQSLMFCDGEYFYGIEGDSGDITLRVVNASTLGFVRNRFVYLGDSSRADFITPVYLEGGKIYAYFQTGKRINVTDWNLSNSPDVQIFPRLYHENTSISSSHGFGWSTSGDKYGYAAFGSFPTIIGNATDGQGASRGCLFPLTTDSFYQDLGTCVVLPTPVTKTSEQTMKITYELTFNFK